MQAGISSAQITTRTIQDTDVGNGLGPVNYVGEWSTCTGCPPATEDSSYHLSYDRGATVSIRFSGTQVAIYGISHPNGGIAAISIDGAAPATVDTYAAIPSPRLLYQSTTLDLQLHTATITNTGQHGPSSPTTLVSFDRVVIGTDAGVTPPLGFRSGLPWLSGIWANELMVPSVTDAFCDTRGTPCDLAHTYVARNSWANIVEPSFAQTNYAGWPGRLVISVPPFPEGQGNSLAACATGAYDSYWRTFGNTLNTTGRQDSVIRIAWEANGNWYEWSATNPTAYINCWRHIADAINSTATPDPMLSWTLNAGYSQNPPSHNPLDIYPGDQWVDIIGIDDYDHYPPSLSYAAFNARANSQGGITWLYNFARSHGKLFGVGEWGVAPGSGANGGGDNPNFITWMYDWFRARAGQGTFYYEMYFNVCTPGNVGSNLYGTVRPTCSFRNVASAARYTALW